jgi:uncharacterized membrane protein YeaQ/YmgE (transglycosylase-associated protein family)
MDTTGLLLFLLIGVVAGWLAGRLLRGGGLGLVGNLIVGVIGAFIGGWLFSALGVSIGGLIGSLVMATVGAMVLLFLIGLPRRALEGVVCDRRP